MSTMAKKKACGVPCQVAEVESGQKHKALAQIPPQSERLDRRLVLLTQYCMSSNLKNFTPKGTMESCPFTKL